jgi:hypothetical protein
MHVHVLFVLTRVKIKGYSLIQLVEIFGKSYLSPCKFLPLFRDEVLYCVSSSSTILCDINLVYRFSVEIMVLKYFTC